MTPVTTPKPHLPQTDVPDEVEPGSLPVAPDRGPGPSPIPDDPAHPRTLDPQA